MRTIVSTQEWVCLVRGGSGGMPPTCVPLNPREGPAIQLRFPDAVEKRGSSFVAMAYFWRKLGKEVLDHLRLPSIYVNSVRSTCHPPPFCWFVAQLQGSNCPSLLPLLPLG